MEHMGLIFGTPFGELPLATFTRARIRVAPLQSFVRENTQMLVFLIPNRCFLIALLL